MGEVVQIRDYRRKEEREAELLRIARRLFADDTSPSEILSPYQAQEDDPA